MSTKPLKQIASWDVIKEERMFTRVMIAIRMYAGFCYRYTVRLKPGPVPGNNITVSVCCLLSPGTGMASPLL